MADRTSAGVFAQFFEKAAKLGLSKNDPLVRFMWKARLEYDFSDYQMESDDALIRLGLARRGIDPEYSEDEETTLYDP